MRARSRRALLWEGGQQFICCVAAAFGAGGELSAYVNSALRGRVSEGYKGRRDLEDRARRSARAGGMDTPDSPGRQRERMGSPSLKMAGGIGARTGQPGPTGEQAVRLDSRAAAGW